MNYLKRSLGNAWDFLKGTQAYFRDVLLMHGFILFICLPLEASLQTPDQFSVVCGDFGRTTARLPFYLSCRATIY